MKLPVGLVHALHEVGGSEEHASQPFFHLFVRQPHLLIEHQDPEELLNLVFSFSPPHDEMVFHEAHVHLLPEGPEGKRGIGELFQPVDHPGPYGVAVDIPDTGEIVFIGIDDTGSVPVPPQVSGPPDMFVVSDSDPGVEVLHGPVDIFLGCGGDDVVVVGHEDDVMDEKSIFFMGFLEGGKDDADDRALMEPERPVVGPADQVVGQDVLDDPSWTSHVLLVARSLPKHPFTTNNLL